MTITSVIVLYAVTWFMCLFIALPIRVTTQNDTGEIIPGTAPSAPVNPRLGRKFFWVTVVSTVIWAALCAFILSGALTVHDIDFFNRM
ncbi:DUF1467 family protein [Paroceanicella profunda]|uniref:DUF1467 family protein n=1 Tax=Paroceanicella profunda TaxID=2579971 RepID=A0A5B8FWT9_9RHOB|nr:DUF1467 family protein [Paroceanicella profunda]QDL92024.1 DUF1467 family protein [Paroceanicella profunda]